MSQDPYTDAFQLCDDGGIVSDTPVAPGTPGAAFDSELTYLKLFNNLRRYDGLEPYAGHPLRCTGSVHLAGLHIRCTNPIHVQLAYYPPAGSADTAAGNAGKISAPSSPSTSEEP